MRRLTSGLLAAVLVAACGGAATTDTTVGIRSTTEPMSETTEPMTETTAPMSEATAPMTETTAAAGGDVLEVAAAEGDLGTFLAALEAAGIMEDFHGEGPFTLFAPTDDAFASYMSDAGMSQEEVFAEAEMLQGVLSYHVVSGMDDAEMVMGMAGRSFTTLSGQPLDVTVDGDTVIVGDATVERYDLARGVEELVAISLAPYRCEVSTDAYETAVRTAVNTRHDGVSVRFPQDWNLHPRYLDALAETLEASLAVAPAATPVVLTAHSLPQRMIQQGDPYADQLSATAASVVDRVGIGDWHLAYQSVSAAASEPWLGPSVKEVIDRLAAEGRQAVVVDPIGFVSDHLETLYDNDIEHRSHAERLGVAFHRCRCLNDHPGFIAALADIALTTDRG